MSKQVYLNGSYVPYTEARVPIEDRGFQFADGLYEVVQVIGGRLFAMLPHLERLEDGAREMRIPVPLSQDEFTSIARHLIETNGVEDGIIYIQLTRGVARRLHAFPRTAPSPTVVVMARETLPVPPSHREKGVSVITVPDNRWGLCYIKTIGLVPNVLAKQRAVRAGAFEALFVRDGIVTEGSSSNLFAASEGVIWTYPLANILPGVTRRIAIDVCRAEGLEVREQSFTLDWLLERDEVFITATSIGLAPVVSVDGKPIGSGTPGPVYARAVAAFDHFVERALREEA